MLISTKRIQSYSTRDLDGNAGQIQDLYIDDQAWVVRYLVVKVTDDRPPCRILIPAGFLGAVDPLTEVFSVLLTRGQVRNRPAIDADNSDSYGYREKSVTADSYAANGIGGLVGHQGSYPGAFSAECPPIITDAAWDIAQTLRARASSRAYVDAHPYSTQHLRSALGVSHCHVHALDGDVGYVQELLIEEKTWAVRYLVVKTSAWPIRHHTLVSADWVVNTDYENARIAVDLPRDAIRSAPAYDPAHSPDRQFELQLFGHYGRPGYWSAGSLPRLPSTEIIAPSTPP